MTNPLRKALITAASSGIGAVYANRLARRGYDLIVVGPHREGLKSVLRGITGDTNRSIEIIAADLTNPADLRRVEYVLRTDPEIELLVNNADSTMAGDFATSDADGLEGMIGLNVVAPTRLAAAVIPGFIARCRGTLINVSSAVALAPEWINGAYSGTKAYLLNLSLRLQQEAAGKGVRVQVVLPGALRIGLWETSGVNGTDFSSAMWIDAEEIVDAALVGLDNGETLTIPSLPDGAEWDAYEAARQHMLRKLSVSTPARRYDAFAALPTTTSVVHEPS